MWFALDLADDTGIGQEDPGGGIVSLIGGTAGMNMVRVPVRGAPTTKQN